MSWESFGTNILGTLIGVFFAIVFAILWDRSKKKTDRDETKIRIFKSLQEEMKGNLKGLNQYQMPTWDSNDSKFKGMFSLCSSSAFQSIINSGDFLVLPTVMQSGVTNIYENFKLYNKFMHEVIDFTSHTSPLITQSAVQEMIRRLQERKTHLQSGLPDIITALDTLGNS